MKIETTDDTTHYLTMPIEQLASQVSQMGGKQQEILRMYITGYSLEEISQYFHYSVAEIREMLNQSLESIK